MYIKIIALASDCSAEKRVRLLIILTTLCPRKKFSFNLVSLEMNLKALENCFIVHVR